MSSLPNVTRYMNAVQFLSDYYSHRKALDNDFSYQTWASELGFKNRSFLRLIVNGGRQITESSRRILENGLGLQGLEKEYFAHLVAYSQEKQEDKKKKALEKMISIVRLTHDRIEVSDHEEFLATPAIPALQVLLTFEDLTKTPANLARLLGCELQTVENWLALLDRLGLARRAPASEAWQATAKNFRIPEKLGSQPLQRYHASVLTSAIDATQLPPQTRKFRTLIIALSADEYSEFTSKMNEFAAQILSQYSHAELKDRDLYFFTNSLFPVRVAPLPLENNERKELSLPAPADVR